jgi:hypothetical protein
MVAIHVKRRRVSNVRKVILLIAAVGLFVICTSIRLMYTTRQIMSQGLLLITPPVTLVIHPSSCEEGPTTNISTTLLSKPNLERRRGDFPVYHHISQLLEGPALSTTTNVDENAVCKFRWVKYWDHFPHT